ncbi:MAG: hypothetical protein KatS3mg076_2758 [Candidatus Binatia bacterium]|nr:MAG: hypothetical protein KatS3mg076_2758 [Candidatus Binatia bacterium]
MVARVRAGGHWLSHGYLGCLGTGMPFALAAKVAHPEKTVVCVTGDGSVGLNFAEFDTMVRHGLPVVTVVNNDRQWGMSAHGQDLIYGEGKARRHGASAHALRSGRRGIRLSRGARREARGAPARARAGARERKAGLCERAYRSEGDRSDHDRDGGRHDGGGGEGAEGKRGGAKRRRKESAPSVLRRPGGIVRGNPGGRKTRRSKSRGEKPSREGSAFPAEGRMKARSERAGRRFCRRGAALGWLGPVRASSPAAVGGPLQIARKTRPAGCAFAFSARAREAELPGR